jgi:hypothetical protein
MLLVVLVIAEFVRKSVMLTSATANFQQGYLVHALEQSFFVTVLIFITSILANHTATR